MGNQTNIAWCDKTFNPWVGCTKVSPACDNCYAEKWAKRSGSVEWGGEPRRTSKANWKQPIKWDKEAKEKGIRYKVFCASLADVFDNKVPDSWRHDLLKLIADTPNLDWLILTKRVGNILKMNWQVASRNAEYSNIWLGITVCNQQEADRDIPKLLEIPSAKKFLSIEPMLGPITLENYLNKSYDPATRGLREGKPYYQLGYIDWVIVGGETGANARPIMPNWVRLIKNQCIKHNTAFFFKQWGEYLSESQDVQKAITKQHDIVGYAHPQLGFETTYRVGKSKAGHLLDGKEYYQFPE